MASSERQMLVELDLLAEELAERIIDFARDAPELFEGCSVLDVHDLAEDGDYDRVFGEMFGELRAYGDRLARLGAPTEVAIGFGLSVGSKLAQKARKPVTSPHRPPQRF